MFSSEYTGRIIPTAEFKTDAFLVSLKESFKYHWRHGYRQDLGKDSLFERPEEAQQYHIRKVHVNIQQYASYSYSCTEECWDEWSYGKLDERGNFRATPTSNAYLIYAVNDRRDAVLLAYWDPPAHTKANESAWMGSVINFTRVFHEKTGTHPMPRDINLWGPSFKVEKLA